ncbi:MAG TPA: serine/threonine-protein kinase, partial [Candidatus Limnocylindria bacterium]
MLADRYRVERELGQGGMAIVYLARDLRHDRPVALKLLRPELAAAVGRDRFLREIQLTARLQHPHILPVFDSGEAAGQLWYVMPFVDGETLRARMAREGRLPPGTATQLAREVASALAYAHDAGVVHRDIKPENILLSRQGQALVADFGIARALDSDSALTETGLALGTPAYMAPEQLLGERPVRPQADVYALGAVLYEMLAGYRPFADSAPAAMLAKRLTDGSPLISAQHPDVPAPLALLIRDSLEVDPARRPPDGAAVAERLQEGAGSPAPATAAPSPASRPGRHRYVLPALGVLALATAIVFLQSRTRGPAEVSIGVLPFENRSGDTAQAYLSEGVSDELTARLSMIPELRVSPRRSSTRFRDNQEAPEVIAQKLGVTYLLTG